MPSAQRIEKFPKDRVREHRGLLGAASNNGAASSDLAAALEPKGAVASQQPRSLPRPRSLPLFPPISEHLPSL